jgi:glutaredoxin
LSVLTLLGKPGCHLCEEMRALVERVLQGTTLRLQEVDIQDHPDLEKLYLFEIPVLLFEGREIARYRTSEAELRTGLHGLVSP